MGGGLLAADGYRRERQHGDDFLGAAQIDRAEKEIIVDISRPRRTPVERLPLDSEREAA